MVFVPAPVNPVVMLVESLHEIVELVNVYPLAYGATLKVADIVFAVLENAWDVIDVHAAGARVGTATA